ncbi:helix-turn-helix transcriptional regulator [uncultured Blautia sp.]|jgi:transcriptional regulator with XRE-family HTH domain|uniref:helix-turn-helix domain-containing protein n=1 Tax=uncultured Blautia sp. TaxID=765821 RepID=UPI001EB5E551|nr:helix-turn-helix transcriptional regulator [uncultured Blautia sp.]MBS5197911.1 helix-turn-helix transcriptional regulator [Clostridiales bacterium]
METEYLKKFGRRVRELRQETGLSQEKFALKIGMDRTYFASVETGKRNVSLMNIKKIADGLSVSMATLFENVED